MRLNIGMLGAEQRLDAIAGQRLNFVDEFAAAVITPAGIALGVLVREDGAGGFEDRGARVVFGGDQLQSLGLPPPLALDGLKDFMIRVLEAA
jgi:hypothetical protein